MTRPKVEKAILSVLGNKSEGLYSVPSKPNKTESSLGGRYYTFSRIVNDSTFNVTLRFFGKDGLKLESYLSVSNKQVDDFLVNNGFQEKEIRKPGVVYFKMESFLASSVVGSVYLQNGGSLESIDTMRVANLIHDRYFNFVNNDCIAKMDSVFNLEALLNDPAQFLNDDSLDYSYLRPMQAKILMGVVLAMICKRQGYEDVLEIYRTIIKKEFKPNQHEHIDFCITLLEIKY